MSAQQGLRLAAQLESPALQPARVLTFPWQVSFVVMGNVFPNDVPLHRKYDLKGSTYGRTAGKKLNSPGAMLKVRPIVPPWGSP